MRRAPDFWWRPPGLASLLLAPLGAIYGAVAGARLKQRGENVGLPVICVGDPTVGGAGKTPTAIALAKLLIGAGERPYFLTRGYGGHERGPLLVDPASHSADAVGDEPLLLALMAPTVVAADRVAGARFAKSANATVIVMDDGCQNPALAKNFSLLVVDGASGVGNGRVFPAGPLRAPLVAQIEKAQALVCIGKGAAGDAVSALAAKKGIPVFRAKLNHGPLATQTLPKLRVLAFAGIGRPEKFFRSLAEAGADVIEHRAFPDHHPYSAREAAALLAAAEADNLTLVTTAKDRARMTGIRELSTLHSGSMTLPVMLEFADEAGLMRSVKGAFGR